MRILIALLLMCGICFADDCSFDCGCKICPDCGEVYIRQCIKHADYPGIFTDSNENGIDDRFEQKINP